MKYVCLLIFLISNIVYGTCMSAAVTGQDLALWHNEAMRLPWFTKWSRVLDLQAPFAHWFVDGEINASYACIDQHINKGKSEKPAIYWTNEHSESQVITYGQLYKDINKFAYYLRSCGVGMGDKVVIYMPMIPEALIAMLACARLGVIHVVVFSGFSAQALKERIIDTKAKLVLTCDISYYRGKILKLKTIVDQALGDNDTNSKVVMIKRGQESVAMVDGRDFEYNTAHYKDVYVEPVSVESNHPLFILYTSGTTGKPKGIIHSTGGYLTYVFSTIEWAFGINQDSVYWCTADFGWITGHSYGVYGPLMHGATIVMREGAPDFPDARAWWQVIDRYKVSIFYTSPTALRMFMRLGLDLLEGASLQSLRVLGSVGEPINPEVWQWYHEYIGKKTCPIIDTWWQTETGGFMVAPTAGLKLVDLKPGSATMPMPSIGAAVVDAHGDQVPAGTKGFLVITKPWPGMAIGIYNNPALFKDTYWSRYPGMYYAGDYAICDKDGYFWMLGRADEVIKVSGHRIGTVEIESVVLEHKGVAESAAVGVNDAIKGEAIVIFVVLKTDYKVEATFHDEIIQLVRSKIGSFATPKEIYRVEKLPKTRSGKIMRRLLKAMIEGKIVGDISTLEDGASIEEIQQVLQSAHQYIKRTRI